MEVRHANTTTNPESQTEKVQSLSQVQQTGSIAPTPLQDLSFAVEGEMSGGLRKNFARQWIDNLFRRG